MVDFRELLGKEKIEKFVDPIKIFNDSDRKSGKEFLRPVQETVLRDWFEQHRDKRELIVKLHTGQGKTLIGLLMLQSFLNKGIGPAIYLCPNNFLVSQTIEQAKSFGINVVKIADKKTELISSC
ncbi:MAG: DEAD/DEAH box helicase family protein [Candidatus Hodarchaeales archaeon]